MRQEIPALAGRRQTITTAALQPLINLPKSGQRHVSKLDIHEIQAGNLAPGAEGMAPALLDMPRWV
jgi:hypothetical protein